MFIFHPQKGIPEVAASRLQQWARILSAYNYKVHYQLSAQHGNADALSRLPLDNDEALESDEEDEILFNRGTAVVQIATKRKGHQESHRTGRNFSQAFNYTLRG